MYGRRTSGTITLPFACFALAPQARATCQNGCLTNENTVLGDDALISNTTGFDNTATGFQALFNNRIGSFNTATGFQALFSNTTGSANTAYGGAALTSNIDGGSNTAIGNDALMNNTAASATRPPVLGRSRTTPGALTVRPPAFLR